MRFGSDGKQYCQRRVGEEYLDRNVKWTVKHGKGKVMIWGVISYHGVGHLHRVEGNMDSDQFTLIMDTSFIRSLRDQKVHPTDIIYVQDNDPKHVSHLSNEWFEDNGIEVLDWPPFSPDMNIIEHAWAILERRLRAHRLGVPAGRVRSDTGR